MKIITINDDETVERLECYLPITTNAVEEKANEEFWLKKTNEKLLGVISKREVQSGSEKRMHWSLKVIINKKPIGVIQ